MSKQKFRTSAQDAPPPYKPTREIRPGVVAPNRIGVYDRGPDGKPRLRGQVGPKMTSAGVARFHGQHGSKLGVVDGRTAWVLPTLADVSAAGVAATPDNPGDTLADVSSRGATAVQIKGGQSS
jgi:hypothetical protein